MILPDHVKIHDVINVMHTVPFSEQEKDISSLVIIRPDPIPTIEGDKYVVEKILAHRKRGRGYQFLTLWKGYPDHEAQWLPAKNFSRC